MEVRKQKKPVAEEGLGLVQRGRKGAEKPTVTEPEDIVQSDIKG